MSAFTTLMTPQGMQGLGALVFPKADPFEMNGFSRVSTGARRVVTAPSEQQLMALIMKERQDRFAQEGFSRVKNPSRIMTETGPQDFKKEEEYVKAKTPDKLRSSDIGLTFGGKTTEADVRKKITGIDREWTDVIKSLIQGKDAKGYKASEFDPTIEIEVVDGKLVAKDGNHRLVAYQELGIKDVPVKYSDEAIEQFKSEWQAANRAKGTRPEDFKTADEYVASKKKLYHGTKEDFDTFDIERSGEIQPSDWGQGAYFTDNPEHAKNFAKVAGGDVVLERYAPDVKFADGDKLLKDSDFMLALDDEMGFTSPAEYLAEKGFGGIKFKNPQGFTEYVVFDPKQIKTKSQLTAEWQAARGKK
jgi:hypothetical protein